MKTMSSGHAKGKVWLKDGYLVEHNANGHGIHRYWSPNQIETLKRRFPYEKTADIAIDLGFSEEMVRRKAKSLGITKDPEYMRSLYERKSRMYRVVPEYKRFIPNYIGTYLKNETEEQKKARYEKIHATKTSSAYRALHKSKPRQRTPEEREAFARKMSEIRKRAIAEGAVDKFRETMMNKPKSLKEETRRKQSIAQKKRIHERKLQNQGNA